MADKGHDHRAIWCGIQAILRLGRMKMTVFSAVTYGAAASLAGMSELDSGLFLAGWVFVFFTQMVAHFLGEYYDFPSDKLNVHAGPLTGGSKVLITGKISAKQCFALGHLCFAIALVILLGLLPSHSWSIGFILMAIAHQYSSPPFRVNHRGLGEVVASIATNVLLPVFAVVLQFSDGALDSGVSLFRKLAILVFPSFFIKMATFLALNIADRRPDWLGGKNTVPVLLGDEAAARLIGAFYVMAYLSAFSIYCLGYCHATNLAAILLSAPEGLSIAVAFNPSLVASLKRRGKQDTRYRPYRIEGLVIRILKHAPQVVIAVFFDTILREILAIGDVGSEIATVNESHDPAANRGERILRWLMGIATAAHDRSLLVRCLPLIPFLYMYFVRTPEKPARQESQSSAASVTKRESSGIIVAGGGIGGLVLGACLQELGLPYEVLEKSSLEEAEGGADLALWPAATKILKELGMGLTTTTDGDTVDSKFWVSETYPVHLVRISKVTNTRNKEPPSLSSSHSKGSDGDKSCESSSAIQHSPEEVLTTVNMDTVVEGQQEPFQLVGRKALMSALASLMQKDCVQQGVRVVEAEQIFTQQEQLAAVRIVKTEEAEGSAQKPASVEERRTCRVLVGADGIHSVCHGAVSAAAAATVTGVDSHEVIASSAAASTEASRYGGEVCYRGVIDLKDGSAAASAGVRCLFEEDEKRRPGSMCVVYSDRIRFSWGYLNSAHDTGYWFVKQLTGGKDTDARHDHVTPEQVWMKWPEPLRTLAKLTGESCSYVHCIQDRPPLERWSCGNITLLGDACHPTTPNNGQGACMAIEDAFVLATLLAKFWDEPDGHLEAFYQYERARLPHTMRVQQGSYKQMKLGQLTSPLGIWVRDLAIRTLPPSVMQKKLRASNVFDINPWLKSFRELKAQRSGKKP